MKIPPILFRDERFVVLNKPAGLKVHPGPGGGPSVEDCFPSLSTRRDGPWLAHRLDADTAGCLVIALRRAALHAAQAAFAAGRARKTYWAVVVGCPAEATGVISLPLSRQTKLPGGTRDGGCASMHRDKKRSLHGGCWGRRAGSRGWRSTRAQAGPINCGCIARSWAGRFWAMRCTGRVAGRCICWHGPLRCNWPHRLPR